MLTAGKTIGKLSRSDSGQKGSWAGSVATRYRSGALCLPGLPPVLSAASAQTWLCTPSAFQAFSRNLLIVFPPFTFQIPSQLVPECLGTTSDLGPWKAATLPGFKQNTRAGQEFHIDIFINANCFNFFFF